MEMIYLSTHIVMATCFTVIVTGSIYSKSFERNSAEKMIKENKSNNEKNARKVMLDFYSLGIGKTLYIITLCVLYVVGKHFKPNHNHNSLINPGTNLTLRTK